jgi:hypothetical protein
MLDFFLLAISIGFGRLYVSFLILLLVSVAFLVLFLMFILILAKTLSGGGAGDDLLSVFGDLWEIGGFFKI